VRTKTQQPEDLCIKRRFISECLRYGFELVRRYVAFMRDGGDNTYLLAPTKRNDHPLADPDLKTAIQIVEQAIERHIKRDLEYACVIVLHGGREAEIGLWSKAPVG